MTSEAARRALDELRDLAAIYHDISGGSHIKTKPLTQLSDMISETIDYLSTTVKGQT